MKKRMLLVLATFGSAWSQSQAEPEPAPEGSQKILYLPNVPAPVRQRMRGRGSTRFYGETLIKGKTVALHLYNMGRAKSEHYEATVTDVNQETRLDIFVQNQVKGRTVFERVRSLPLSFSGFKGGKSKVVFDAMWLDPVAQTIPILKLDFESRASGGGIAASELLFVFPKGLRGSVAQQGFYYDFLEGPVSISGCSFGKTDSRGYLTMVESSTDGSNLDLVGMHWNGKQFAPVAEGHEDRNSSVRVEWNGEKMEYIDQAKLLVQ